MGERPPLTDLMAWNAKQPACPIGCMPTLRHLFLDNDLAEGRLDVDDRPIVLTDLCVPIFAGGTERDHVAPWRSTYKIPTDTVLTGSGRALQP
jgi:polyhydroxyalkanoate synthase subunit PhaC